MGRTLLPTTLSRQKLQQLLFECARRRFAGDPTVDYELALQLEVTKVGRKVAFVGRRPGDPCSAVALIAALAGPGLQQRATPHTP
jgi:hypothetical protein